MSLKEEDTRIPATAAIVVDVVVVVVVLHGHVPLNAASSLEIVTWFLKQIVHKC